MNTLNKPPLPNYTVTTIRPCFGNLSGNLKIDQENKKMDAERKSIIAKFRQQLEEYRKSSCS